jgi:hypothetical protein
VPELGPARAEGPRSVTCCQPCARVRARVRVRGVAGAARGAGAARAPPPAAPAAALPGTTQPPHQTTPAPSSENAFPFKPYLDIIYARFVQAN